MEQQFRVEVKDDVHGVKKQKSVVAVIVYTLDDDGLLDRVGIVTEKNPFFSSGTVQCLVMGTVENNDSSLMSRAKQETLEESGYDVKDSSLWSFIGEIYPIKYFIDPVYCYSVNVTGIKSGEILGDGSAKEEGIKFSLLTLNEALQINDALFQACFFKLFTQLYKQDLSNYGITKSQTAETVG